MAVGDVERAFQRAAMDDGIILERHKVPWLNQRGHFGLPGEAAEAAASLDRVFDELGGRRDEQTAKRTTALPGDFVHPASGTVIEVDELQHFTTHRLHTFAFYPGDAPLGYSADDYMDLCRRLSPKADRYRQGKAAIGFGEGGRQRQRAYYDALRDLAIPAMGHPTVIRVPAVDGDGHAAYLRTRDAIHAAVVR